MYDTHDNNDENPVTLQKMGEKLVQTHTRTGSPRHSSMTRTSRTPRVTGRTQCILCETKTTASPGAARPAETSVPSFSRVQRSPPSKSTAGSASIMSIVRRLPLSKCVGSGREPPGVTTWCSAQRIASSPASIPRSTPHPVADVAVALGSVFEPASNTSEEDTSEEEAGLELAVLLVERELA